MREKKGRKDGERREEERKGGDTHTEREGMHKMLPHIQKYQLCRTKKSVVSKRYDRKNNFRR